MSTKFNKEVLKDNGLACPFEKSDPEKYKDILACKPGKGWSQVKDISEHVWRFHTPLYNCKDCGYYWTAVRNRKAIREEKEKHVCKSQDGGKKNRARARARNKAEIMSEKQQEELENVKAIKDIEKKLKVLYEACGKPIPETYHINSLVDTAVKAKPLPPPPPSRSSTTSSLLNGFTRPDENPQPSVQHGPLSPTTLDWNSIQAQADGQSLIPSGADRCPDIDSGYGSKPEGQDIKPIDNDGGRLSPCSRLLQSGSDSNLSTSYMGGGAGDLQTREEDKPDLWLTMTNNNKE